MKILITGANGQLGSELKEISKNNSNYFFDFVDIDELNITSKFQVEEYFKNNKFNYCINCAAYTAVDKSETHIDQAELVNVIGTQNLASACINFDVILIHVSTDFVFDGEKNTSYIEIDSTNPLSVYGKTKLKSEHQVLSILKKYFIIRTSWLYSSFGNNFVKTMLQLAETKESLGVVDDQIGTPTFAGDLAKLIIKIVESNNSAYGIYHYSNEGLASWYDFAQAIFDYSDKGIKLLPIKTEQFPLPATRPKFTVLNKTKVKNNLEITIPHWTESLKVCLNIIENRLSKDKKNDTIC